MAGAVVVVLALVTACGDGDDDGATPSASPSASASPSPAPSGSTSATASPSASPTPSAPTSTSPATSLRSIPVYYVAESRSSFALYREFRTVPDVGGPVVSAVSAMTRLAPLDRDYTSPWRPARRVTATQRGAAITVDLSADAFSNGDVGSELAETALQQLVHTATAAAAQSGTPATTVTITRDGRAADVWGAVRIGSPMRRAPMADIQAHAWVTSPQEGEVRRAGTVTFAGFGTSFEATFGWVVRTSSGAEVARGSAMGGTGTGGFGSLSFTARLTPGTYTVTLSTDDPSGGAEGAGPATDDKTFTVR
ncbi:hypothetical protein N801_12195 [Knoellia aerolata DSM 18566]|uniref:GerMN domain-containing protein n=1 Tax=Knoellia aerolata DSM 18566 TaxID=1385519 RepID=A0A0A0JZ29_9MICO|nr:hypothetical protein N801_12195 [Knoellia aerolata DSM 18566]